MVVFLLIALNLNFNRVGDLFLISLKDFSPDDLRDKKPLIAVSELILQENRAVLPEGVQ